MNYSRVFQIRDSSDLPFYCSPIRLFIAVWLLMLITFEFHISYTSYPELSAALLLFIISLFSLLLGYATVRLAYSATGGQFLLAAAYKIDIKRLRRFHVICLAVTVSIFAFNLMRDGPPPLLGFFGVDTDKYSEYGSLKQVLFPAFMALFLTAPLEPSRLRRWFFYAFGPLCAFAYASRGFLLIMLFQFLVVFTLRSTLSRKKIYLIAFCTLCVAIGLSDLIGNGRSSAGSAGLLLYMQIKRSYYDWPTAGLWLISYVSSPISNLCWIVRAYHYDQPSASFLHSLVPGFWNSPTLEVSDLGSENIVDGVHTYIAKYYLDFWWFGVFGINYIWGLVSGYINAGNRLTRNYLTSSVLLGCIGFIFFADYLTFLIIWVELAILGLGQRYFTIQYGGVNKSPARIEAD